MKIYTKTGDFGETSLYGGKRVPKNNLRVSVYGIIDELNSLLGVVLSKKLNKRIDIFINQIQKDLFLIGGYLAGAKVSIGNLSQQVKEMEKLIDSLDEELPRLQNFILPRGSEKSAFLYLARSVARRAERELVSLSKIEKVDEDVLKYMNRLSDLLFIMGRYINYKSGIPEPIWKN